MTCHDLSQSSWARFQRSDRPLPQPPFAMSTPASASALEATPGVTGGAAVDDERDTQAPRWPRSRHGDAAPGRRSARRRTPCCRRSWAASPRRLRAQRRRARRRSSRSTDPRATPPRDRGGAGPRGVWNGTSSASARVVSRELDHVVGRVTGEQRPARPRSSRRARRPASSRRRAPRRARLRRARTG